MDWFNRGVYFHLLYLYIINILWTRSWTRIPYLGWQFLRKKSFEWCDNSFSFHKNFEIFLLRIPFSEQIVRKSNASPFNPSNMNQTLSDIL